MAMVSDSARLTALEEIVKRRTKTLDYLQRVYSGSARFLNLFRLAESDIAAAYPSERQPEVAKRVEKWFSLGISLAPLIQSENGVPFVRAIAQLLEEHEYFYGHAASKGIFMLRAAMSSGSRGADGGDTGEIKPVIGNTYQHFQPQNVPFPMSYPAVIQTLVELLSHAYRKLADESCSTFHVFEAVRRLDSKFQALVIQPAVRDLSLVAARLAQQQLVQIAARVQCPAAFLHGSRPPPPPPPSPPAIAAAAAPVAGGSRLSPEQAAAAGARAFASMGPIQRRAAAAPALSAVLAAGASAAADSGVATAGAADASPAGTGAAPLADDGFEVVGDGRSREV